MIIKTKYLIELPEFVVQHVVYHKRIVINRRDTKHVAILDNWKFFLIQNKEVVRSCNLNSSVTDMSCKIYEQDIGFIQLYHQYNDTLQTLYYIIKIRNNIHVVQQDERASLSLVRVLKEIDKIEILNTNNVAIHYKNRRKPIVTNFSPEPEEDLNTKAKASASKILLSDLQQLDDILDERRCHQSIIATETQQQLYKYQVFRDIVPERLNSANSSELLLHKVGDVWKKIHNDKLVIAIPIWNSSDESCITLENLAGILSPVNQASAKVIRQYTTALFKSSDYRKFCHKHKLTSSTFPNFDTLEWKRSEKFSMLPDESAIMTLTIDLSNLLDVASFECFISYDAEIIDGVSHNFSKFIEPIELKLSDIVMNKRYSLKFVDSEVINDLLTVVLTSLEYTCILKCAKEQQHTRFITFLRNAVQFKSIPDTFLSGKFMEHERKGGLDRTMEEIILQPLSKFEAQIFYESPNPLMESIVVRIIDKHSDYYSMRVYAKTENHIIRFFKFIFEKYGEECTLLEVGDKRELKSELLDNINIERKYIKEAVEPGFCPFLLSALEFKTTKLYEKFKKIV